MCDVNCAIADSAVSAITPSQDDRSAGLGRTRLFHPWVREPEGGWPASGVPCRTLSDLDSGQSPRMAPHAEFGQLYSNFWNRPYPLGQNFDTI